jgi:hypothetical protein
MKLSYTTEDIERWRNRIHGRGPHSTLHTKQRVLQFVNGVGYCLAFRSRTSELPSLWDAAYEKRRAAQRKERLRAPELLAREIKSALLSERKFYFGRVLQRRPTLISLNYLPYFYALQGREGNEDDYLQEFMQGRLSSDAKMIMDLLVQSSPRRTAELKEALGNHREVDNKRFERAIIELQSKLLVTEAGERYSRSASSWASVYHRFPSSVKKARKIQPGIAREKILGKFFENQLISSVEDVQRVFAWNKQSIFQAFGGLVQSGLITSNVKVDGKDSKYYCLVH